MTVTTEHDEMNLQHEAGRLIHYAKTGDVPKGFNGYEAGTSIVNKSVVMEFGKEGTWSWEKTVYPAFSRQKFMFISIQQSSGIWVRPSGLNN